MGIGFLLLLVMGVIDIIRLCKGKSKNEGEESRNDISLGKITSEKKSTKKKTKKQNKRE